MVLKHLVLKIPERLKNISELPAAFKIKYKFLFFNNIPILPILPNTFIFHRQTGEMYYPRYTFTYFTLRVFHSALFHTGKISVGLLWIHSSFLSAHVPFSLNVLSLTPLSTKFFSAIYMYSKYWLSVCILFMCSTLLCFRKFIQYLFVLQVLVCSLKWDNKHFICYLSQS